MKQFVTVSGPIKSFTQRSAVVSSLLNLVVLILEAILDWLPAIVEHVPTPWNGLAMAGVMFLQQMIAAWIINLKSKSVKVE